MIWIPLQRHETSNGDVMRGFIDLRIRREKAMKITDSKTVKWIDRKLTKLDPRWVEDPPGSSSCLIYPLLAHSKNNSHLENSDIGNPLRYPPCRKPT